jgi:preprotein translocase subunit SecD
MMKDIIHDRKVQILVVCVLLIGILPLAFKGLKFGMDFSGGSMIEIKLDKKLSTPEMQTVITVIQNRLNGFGLKDMAVKPWGQEYVVVEMAETDPQVINQIQSLLGQQGKFETLYQGKVVLSGSDIISVITDPQKGYGLRQSGQAYEWSVPFLLSSEGSARFAKGVEGQCTPIPNSESCAEEVYMYIDRPENATMLINSTLYDAEKSIPDDMDKSTTTIPIDELVSNSGVVLLVSDSLDADTISKISNRTVVIAAGSFDVAELGKYASKVIERSKVRKYWIADGLNLENIIHLTPGVTSGTPVTSPSITGHAQTQQLATQEMNRVQILLKSGKLPVSVSVGSVSTISATLGPAFLQYSLLGGLSAIVVVSIIIFIRYRKPQIVLPIMMTCLSEVVMILGIAALIGWQIDLPAIAGIVAAVGTGVDHQIIITDEILRREHGVDLSFSARIKKAFSIIFMAASTVIFAMLPLLFMGLGMLKGFAIITILGALIGVIIARPAYAAIISKVV